MSEAPRGILANLPLSTRQVLIIVVCVLLIAIDGFDVLSISFAAPGIAAQWGIERAALGLVLSLELMAMAVGSFVLGSHRRSDRAQTHRAHQPVAGGHRHAGDDGRRQRADPRHLQAADRRRNRRHVAQRQRDRRRIHAADASQPDRDAGDHRVSAGSGRGGQHRLGPAGPL
jgi:hypothetical protein